MKLITAIIQPNKLDEVKNTLVTLANFEQSIIQELLMTCIHLYRVLDASSAQHRH
jgi:hypothetical protein